MKDAEEDKVGHEGSRQRLQERGKEKMYSGGERVRGRHWGEEKVKR